MGIRSGSKDLCGQRILNLLYDIAYHPCSIASQICAQTLNDEVLGNAMNKTRRGRCMLKLKPLLRYSTSNSKDDVTMTLKGRERRMAEEGITVGVWYREMEVK